MINLEIDKDKVYYLEDGSAVKVVCNMEDSFIVEYVWEGDYRDIETEDCVYPSSMCKPSCEYIRVSAIFEKAPTVKLDEQYKKLKDEIDNARTVLSELETRVCKKQDEQEAMFKQFAKYKGLELVKDFVDGKITHFLKENYNSYEIIPFNDLCQRDSWTRRTEGLKLVSLMGKSNGDLEYRVHEYSDGSGSTWSIYPCRSEQEAIDKRNSLVMKKINDLDLKLASDYTVINVIGEAIKLKLPIDDIYMEVYNKAVKNQRNARLKELQEQADKIKADLDELEKQI